MNKRFSWLHLSDLHAGVDTQSWLWPNLKERFFEDLRRIYDSTGGWDLVIFSGDLTQSGSAADYIALNAVLTDIWEKFDQLKCRPLLFVVPGNHDFVRPSDSTPVSIAMQSWWQNPVVKEQFWKDDTNEYRKFVQTAFHNYSEWKASGVPAGVPLATGKEGALPGDCSAVITANGVQVGIIGLNTAHLQLCTPNQQGRVRNFVWRGRFLSQ